MKKNSGRYISLALLVMTGLWQPACINIKMVNVGQKTAYERQLTGTYEELDANLATSASMRGGSGSGNDGGAESYQKAVSARRRQHFNEDDIASLKKVGCLGESYRGFIIEHNCQEKTGNQQLQELIKRLIKEENQDRRAIIELAIDSDSSLTPASSADLRQVFYHLFRKNAPRGYWFEESAGQWIKIN